LESGERLLFVAGGERLTHRFDGSTQTRTQAAVVRAALERLTGALASLSRVGHVLQPRNTWKKL
jgi:hypothetical protein